MRYLIISDIHANLEAFETVLAAAQRWARTASSCSAISSATAPIPMPWSRSVRELDPHALIRGNHDKVGSGIESPEGLQRRRAQRHPLDLRRPHRRKSRVAGRAARRPGRRRRLSRFATARRSTKTRTSSTISTRSARCTRPTARCACSVTLTFRSDTPERRSVHAHHDGRRAAAEHRFSRGIEALDQPGVSGPTARR